MVVAEDAPDSPNDENQLFATGNQGVYQDGLQLNKSMMATSVGKNYEFTYRIRSGSFMDNCMSQSGKCYPFKYDLHISMTDECGVEVLNGGQGITYTDIGGSHSSYTNCTSFDQAYTFNALNLPVGTYTLTKTLTVNDASMEAYLSDYLSDANCSMELEDFYEEPDSDCDTDCEECEVSLNADFDDYMLSEGYDPQDPQDVLDA
ncbi:MAG: hypothetical protein GWN14_28955, partial [candidate division Zixibacteria bacterium]|nr:hypothetical protein [candidate division Zixibacteria bacterium]